MKTSVENLKIECFDDHGNPTTRDLRICTNDGQFMSNRVQSLCRHYPDRIIGFPPKLYQEIWDNWRDLANIARDAVEVNHLDPARLNEILDIAPPDIFYSVADIPEAVYYLLRSRRRLSHYIDQLLNL